MSNSKDDRRRPRRKRRRKKPRRSTDDDRHNDDHPQLDDVVVVGHGEHCVITIPVDGGKTVIHRFETREAAEEQNRKNIAHDQPLVGISDAAN